MKKKEALREIAEMAAFWEKVFNEEALRCSESNSVYSNPWFPVEFARKVRELANRRLPD